MKAILLADDGTVLDSFRCVDTVPMQKLLISGFDSLGDELGELDDDGNHRQAVTA